MHIVELLPSFSINALPAGWLRRYGNGLFVYDTQEGVFGSATVSALHDPELLPSGQGCGLFPFNVANPMVSILGDTIAVVGGEINTRQIGQTMYQHDSQSAVLGVITVLQDNNK